MDAFRWHVAGEFYNRYNFMSYLFCIFCSIWGFDLEMSGDHTVLAYSRVGLVIALYVLIRCSFSFSHHVVVRDFIMFNELIALDFGFLVWSQKVSLNSKIAPSIFGFGLLELSIP